MLWCSCMDDIDEGIRNRINRLVDVYRSRCLWFLRPDYYPVDHEDIVRTLDYIRRYGDREAFRQAGEISQWLLPPSSGPSVIS